MVCSSMYSSEHLYMPDPARIAPLEHSPHTETAHARGKTEPGFCPLRYEEYHYISMLLDCELSSESTTEKEKHLHTQTTLG